MSMPIFYSIIYEKNLQIIPTQYVWKQRPCGSPSNGCTVYFQSVSICSQHRCLSNEPCSTLPVECQSHLASIQFYCIELFNHFGEKLHDHSKHHTRSCTFGNPSNGCTVYFQPVCICSQHLYLCNEIRSILLVECRSYLASIQLYSLQNFVTILRKNIDHSQHLTRPCTLGSGVQVGISLPSVTLYLLPASLSIQRTTVYPVS